MNAKCTTCGAPFAREPSQTWRRLCVECWKKTKRKQATAGTHYGGVDVRQLLQHLATWRERAIEAETELAVRERLAGFDLATLKKIRLLTHPDKHGNSAVANEITQRINKMIQEAS